MVKTRAVMDPFSVRQLSHLGKYAPLGISLRHKASIVVGTSVAGMRKATPRHEPPASSPNTSPGWSGVPRFTRDHKHSARWYPCSKACCFSMKSNSGRHISEPYPYTQTSSSRLQPASDCCNDAWRSASVNRRKLPGAGMECGSREKTVFTLGAVPDEALRLRVF